MARVGLREGFRAKRVDVSGEDWKENVFIRCERASEIVIQISRHTSGCITVNHWPD